MYDVKLILRSNKLYVSEVDISQYGFLKRMRLKRVARLIKTPEETHQNGTIPWSYIQPLPNNISSFKGDVKLKVMKEKISEIPSEDLADILEELDHEQRLVLFNQLETEHASDTLEEINPNVQRALISSLEETRRSPHRRDDARPGSGCPCDITMVGCQSNFETPGCDESEKNQRDYRFP